MGKKINSWRQVCRKAAYEYPALRDALNDLRSMSITSRMSGAPAKGGNHRSTEEAALRELPPEQQRKHDAVEQAFEISKQLTSGPSRAQLIELVYFRRTHTVEGAALRIPVSNRQAWAWNNDFLLLIWARLRDV